MPAVGSVSICSNSGTSAAALLGWAVLSPPSSDASAAGKRATALLLALVEGEVAGCCALRPLDTADYANRAGLVADSIISST